MILWLASYPRSGNTFFRIVFHHLYGLPTYSIYADDDPVAQRIGPSLVGYRPKPADHRDMVKDASVHLIKTHKRRKTDGHAAICLVRDGRDAVVSQARLRASEISDSEIAFDDLLRDAITRPFVPAQPSSGSWGGHILSWLDHGRAPLAVVRYEDLIVAPRGTVERTISALLPELAPIADARIPSFAELHGRDPGCFRRGVEGSHRDEMSEELHELFWAQPENAEAMRRLGYAESRIRRAAF